VSAGPEVDAAHIDELIQKIIETPERDFVKLLRMAEFDLAKDLRLHDWSGIDMSGCDLAGCDFTGARFIGCRFDRAKIAGARFDQAEVDRAQLRRAADWTKHGRGWRRNPTPALSDHLPDLAVFSDAPFAPELVVMPAGEFMMGSTEQEEGGYGGERPRHRVTIGQRFAIGRYPVTFEEYVHFCVAEQRKKPDDRGWGRKRRPVIDVSWQDAQDYIAWLCKRSGGLIGCPRKPNGNMPAAPARRPATHSVT
jgi:hypothetical protein